MRTIAASMLGVLAAVGTAAASTFSISPIRIELSGARSTAVLTVRSQDDLPVVVQARPELWSQPEGRDRLEDTRDLLVTPPIFTLAPRGEQLVRIALLRTPDAARELDYRLELAEVPAATPQQFAGVRIALRITVPAFVAAVTRAAPDLIWRHRWLPDGTLELTAENRGTAHIQVREFDVRAEGRAATPLHDNDARYVLPGSSARWRLPAQWPGPPPARLDIRGRSDVGDFTVTSGADAP